MSVKIRKYKRFFHFSIARDKPIWHADKWRGRTVSTGSPAADRSLTDTGWLPWRRRRRRKRRRPRRSNRRSKQASLRTAGRTLILCEILLSTSFQAAGPRSGRFDSEPRHRVFSRVNIPLTPWMAGHRSWRALFMASTIRGRPCRHLRTHRRRPVRYRPSRRPQAAPAPGAR